MKLLPLSLILLFATPLFAQSNAASAPLPKPGIFITRVTEPTDALAKKLLIAVEAELGDDATITEVPQDQDMPEGFGAAFMFVPVDGKIDVVVLETVNDHDHLVEHIAVMAGKFTEDDIETAADLLVGEIEEQYVHTQAKTQAEKTDWLPL
jgi:hypothetical protein